MRRKNHVHIVLLLTAIFFFTECGKSIKTAQDFIPNKAPVMGEITQAMASDGSAVDKTKIISGLPIRVTVPAYDPEGNDLSFDINSANGSVQSIQKLSTGCTFIFYPQNISGNTEIDISIAALDDKKASAATVFNVGTGKSGAILTLAVSGKSSITESGTTSLTLTSSSTGYFEIYCDNTITSVSKMKTKYRTAYEDTDVNGNLLPASLVAVGPSPSSAVSYDVKLVQSGSNTVWVAFIDDNRTITAASCKIIVDSEAPTETHFPTSAASNISMKTKIIVTFSEDIDSSTLPNALTITNGSATIAYTLLSYTKTQAIYKPENSLDKSTSYTVKISGVQDIAGNTMSDDTFTFTTSDGYVLTYYGNGETSGSCPSNAVGTGSITVSDNTGGLSKTGYSFSGWNTNADGSGTTCAVGSAYTLTDDLDLYALWITVPVTSVTLNKSSTSLLIAATETLTATIAPANASTQTVSWSSDNSTIVSVDSSGKITAGSAAGTAVITAKAENCSASCTVSVLTSPIDVTGLTLNTSSLSVAKGSTGQITATITPSDATNQNIEWTSTNTAVATVTNGVVTGVSGGTATITAKALGNTALTQTCTVTVISLTISPTGTASIFNGCVIPFTATVLPASLTVNWTSGTSSVTLSSNSGTSITATAASVGTSLITATVTSNGVSVSGNCSVTVKAIPTNPTTISLTGASFHHLAVNSSTGILYAADNTGGYVRSYYTGTCKTTGTDYSASGVEGVCVDTSGNIYAGSSSSFFNITSSKNYPVTNIGCTQMIYYGGNIYAASSSNHIYILSSTGSPSNYAGTGLAGYDSTSLVATSRSVNAPYGIAAYGGEIYFADTGNNLIRKINSIGYIDLIAGKIGSAGNASGKGPDSTFSSPKGLAFDSYGNLFVCDYTLKYIRKIDITSTDKTVSIFLTLSYQPYGIAIDAAGNIYVSSGTSIYKYAVQ